MPTVEEHDRLIKTIDGLLLEKGDIKKSWCVGSFSAKELLLEAGIPNTENNWRYVIHIMRTFYPDSTGTKGSRDEGYQIKIRTMIK